MPYGIPSSTALRGLGAVADGVNAVALPWWTVPASTLIGRSEILGTVVGVDHYDWIIGGRSYGPLPASDVQISPSWLDEGKNAFKSDNYTYLNTENARVRLSSRSWDGLVALGLLDPTIVPKPSEAPTSGRYGVDDWWSKLGIGAGTLALGAVALLAVWFIPRPRRSGGGR